MTGGDGVELTVAGARKRDAGRGIARLPESVRSKLGVLSGDSIVIDGDQQTVAKVWPGNGDDDAIRIDADTRANAGATIGDTVRVRPATVSHARSVTARPTEDLGEFGGESVAPLVKDGLLDRPLRQGEQFHVEGVGGFEVLDTEPGGSVRVEDTTDVTVAPRESDDGTSGDEATADESTDDAEAESTTYEDIGGLDDELEKVREMIELPLSRPEIFQRLSISPPSGVLLYGPPGTGKTLIARAVANEVDAYFDVISGPEIVSKYKGESEERLREAFDRATENAPAILFIDEVDSIAGARDDDSDMENRVVAQLLTLMDGLEDRGRVVVIGATNRVDAVDPALRRGGRFDREIEIGVPGVEGRREILDVHTRGMPLADDVNLDRLAERTHGFVGADIESLTTEAAMHALRRDDEQPTVGREDFESALASVDPSAMREYVAESPSVDFDDVGGLDDAKATLERAVEWPLLYGPLFEATDTEPPSGVLLHGPPGTGKTLLARALAGESGVNFIHVNGPELLDRYVGESEESVREVFDRARQTAPTIVFLDEIDAIAGRRGDSNEVTERVVSQLLTELDGVAENPNLVVVAATNRKAAIDDALLRPGRLEEHIEVPLPDADARRKIFEVHTRDKPLGEDVDLEELVTRTEGHSGAEIEALVRKATIAAIDDIVFAHAPEEANEYADEISVTAAHFENALEE
ncbi:CDC48 family AAA ATPase [Halapricum hydrolyticum]|uniref:CDC48 family AAA ATPase n=1 Tax=Halapricum hydrolyticum TaxID=2979991 RepID=A0AAE3I8T4_9EURY|nr:CDC48 family AAA ATPase [Halapricum hydrolyticum]MCU4716517.1 CDC48 family AAA ATPase [Halapricum hydrolyticum]MCU4725878.1 CDC48 family AAA ATPase [Halapricum hydrolyticum]